MAGRPRRVPGTFALALLLLIGAAGHTYAQDPPPLTGPVSDFAGVIDEQSRAAIERIGQALQQATGDVVVAATVRTVAPWPDIRSYAVKMFENGGRGIGAKGKDNGVLILLAVEDRRVWVEVGYGLEPYITDGLAGEMSRQVMTPYFREGRYGEGLLAGAQRIASRIAEAKGVTLSEQVAPPRARQTRSRGTGLPLPGGIILLILIVLLMRGLGGGGRGRRQRVWGNHWSGWSSGVGPFGGGFGGGAGGGFGGGFGGFGGGRSGGGGGGASW